MNINRIGAWLKGGVLATAGALAWTSLPAAAADLQFKGGIGVHPVSTVSCAASPANCVATPVTVNRNFVRGVPPAGQIWVIDKLDATVNNGRINVNGQGLILAGGENAGRAPTPALSVVATLFCGPVSSPTESDTNLAGVTLSPTGDFMIKDNLSPPPPTPCDNPMLLIRNAAGLAWFAVGIFRP